MNVCVKGLRRHLPADL